MYAHLTSFRDIDAGRPRIGYQVTADGERVIHMHINGEVYLAASPDEARRIHAALGRALVDAAADENAAAGLCPDGCCDLPTTTSAPDVDEETCRG